MGFRQRQFVLLRHHRKEVFFWKKGFFSGFTKRQMHIAGPFFHLIQTASTLTKDRTGAVRAARRHTYGSIAPRSAEFNAQEADRLRPDICGPTRPNIDSPDRAAFIDFCECLRSVKQSRRLNLQCRSRHCWCLSVRLCAQVCGILARCLHRSYDEKHLSA